MKTERNANQLEFESMGRRRVVASFDGNHVTSDGGLLLLREVAQRTGLLENFAACFRDYRDPTRIEHTVEELVSQRERLVISLLRQARANVSRPRSQMLE